MWAGCIWVPIYEVMTRKHLKIVTLEENLEMAADIGIDATTSLDEAFAEAMERHGPDAKVIVLPFARYQLPTQLVRMDAEPLRFPQEAARALTQPRSGHRRPAVPMPRRAAGRDQRLDDDRRAAAAVPRTARRRGCVPPRHGLRPLRRRVPRAADDGRQAPRRDPRAVLEAFRALDDGGPSAEQVEAACRRVA